MVKKHTLKNLDIVIILVIGFFGGFMVPIFGTIYHMF